MKRLLIVLEIVILTLFLFWHLKLGLVRYFDADEFAHLHWGYSLSIGEKPYTDFFYLFPPFFLYPIAAIFQIFGRTIQAILAARMFIFFVFLATSGILFLIAKKLRGVSFALLTVIFFAFLPLPFDKMIEIRPDMVATMLSMLGLLLFIGGYGGNEGDEGKRKKYFFFSGLSYAASLGFVPKTVFFLVPVAIVFFISHLSSLGHFSRGGKKDTFYFLLGLVPVGLVLLFLLFSYGNLSFSFYSMTKMASEVTKTLGVKFFMRPDIFFYPNDTYYGFGGWSWPLVTTIVIYVVASIWAIHRFLNSVFSTIGGVRASPPLADQLATPEVSSSHVGEFLVAGAFFANLAAFVFFYPLKHAQYLIPVAPFIAFYAADMWESAVSKLFKSPKLLKVGITIVLLFFIVGVGGQMNEKKMQWVNTGTLDKVNYFLKTVPASEPVYDLTGESIFFRNGYYFCCLPYGQYEEALYFKMPDLAEELEKRGTKYVHLGSLSRLNEIPAKHAKYIRENFAPVEEGNLLWERK